MIVSSSIVILSFQHFGAPVGHRLDEPGGSRHNDGSRDRCTKLFSELLNISTGDDGLILRRAIEEDRHRFFCIEFFQIDGKVRL